DSDTSRLDPDQVVRALLRLAANPHDGRRAMAVLRRSLAYPPGSHMPSFEFIEPLVAEATEREREATYLTASLFSVHPRHKNGQRWENLGTSARKLVDARGNRGKSIQIRFERLIERHWPDLHQHLKDFVTLLKSHDIAIDYGRLLKDLIWWGRGKATNRPEIMWAREFFKTSRDQNR